MYDKGNNLRIEVTINNPKDFKVMKEKEKITEHQEITTEKVWVPMGKSISNLYQILVKVLYLSDMIHTEMMKFKRGQSAFKDVFAKMTCLRIFMYI